jgi:hypothetical protein
MTIEYGFFMSNGHICFIQSQFVHFNKDFFFKLRILCQFATSVDTIAGEISKLLFRTFVERSENEPSNACLQLNLHEKIDPRTNYV